MFPRLISQPQAILSSQPPNVLGLQVCATMPGQALTIGLTLCEVLYMSYPLFQM